MLRGDQFIKMLQNKLEVDYQKKEETLRELTNKYPHAVIIVSTYDICARVKQNAAGEILCMKCGTPLINSANQYFRNGAWQAMKRKNNESNMECVKCAPGKGGEPLWIVRNIAKY